MIFVYLILVALAFGALGFLLAALLSSSSWSDAFRAGYGAGQIAAADDPAGVEAARLLADLESYGGTE